MSGIPPRATLPVLAILAVMVLVAGLPVGYTRPLEGRGAGGVAVPLGGGFPSGPRVPHCTDVDRVLRLEDPPLRGHDVWELQERLWQLGFYHGELDGVFDGETSAAVREFQRRRGLPEDGVVLVKTWEMLTGLVPVLSGDVGEETQKPPGRIHLEVDVDELKLKVFSDGKLFKEYPIAIGKWTTPTPVGEFAVIEKFYDPGGAFGTRWMGLNVPWGGYGIHGTNRPWSIGTAASAGCIRMYNHHVEELYELVKPGTRVVIAGREIPERSITRTLREDSTGGDVQFVQKRLRDMGFDPGPLDGHFGGRSKEAVHQLQLFYELPITGEIAENELYVMGLRR